jgi:hypothetical protein
VRRRLRETGLELQRECGPTSFLNSNTASVKHVLGCEM